MKKSEAQIMKEIEIAVSAHGHRVFRVNVGEGYIYREQPTQETLEFENKRARWFKSGPPQGYSDLSGVCYPSGRALFIEVKTPTGKLTKEQCVFLLAMLAAGANAGIARSTDEALAICEMTDELRQKMGEYIHGWLVKLRQRGK